MKASNISSVVSIIERVPSFFCAVRADGTRNPEPAAHMDVRQHVLSAGRAVLDTVEREWQPLSAGELELRLDQAVEEILESELLGKLEAQPPPGVYLHLVRGETTPGPPGLPTAAAFTGRQETAADSDAVKVNMLLQDCFSIFHNIYCLYCDFM